MAGGASIDRLVHLKKCRAVAAPHVAGVAAGYLSLRPRARPAEVRAALVGNATAAGLQQPAGGGAQAGVGGPQLLAGSPRLLLYSRLGGELGAPGSTGGGLATG